MLIGFRLNHSTSHATTSAVENMTKAFESKNVMHGVFWIYRKRLILLVTQYSGQSFTITGLEDCSSQL